MYQEEGKTEGKKNIKSLNFFSYIFFSSAACACFALYLKWSPGLSLTRSVGARRKENVDLELRGSQWCSSLMKFFFEVSF